MIPKLYCIHMEYIEELRLPLFIIKKNVHEFTTLNVVSQLLGEVSYLPLNFLDCSEQCSLDLLACGKCKQTDGLSFLIVFEHTKSKQQ